MSVLIKEPFSSKTETAVQISNPVQIYSKYFASRIGASKWQDMWEILIETIVPQ